MPSLAVSGDFASQVYCSYNVYCITLLATGDHDIIHNNIEVLERDAECKLLLKQRCDKIADLARFVFRHLTSTILIDFYRQRHHKQSTTTGKSSVGTFV